MWSGSEFIGNLTDGDRSRETSMLGWTIPVSLAFGRAVLSQP
jgi:hypothetical protein